MSHWRTFTRAAPSIWNVRYSKALMTHNLASYKPLLKCHFSRKPTLTALFRIATCSSLPGHVGSPTYPILLCFFPQHLSFSYIPCNIYVHANFVGFTVIVQEFGVSSRLTPTLEKGEKVSPPAYSAQKVSAKEEGRCVRLRTPIFQRGGFSGFSE